MAERLQKFLASAGIASRRQAEAMIAAGRVAVNGRVTARPGVTVEPSDKVTVDGQPVKPASQLVYYILNKPKGIITSSADEKGRKTVIDLVPARPRVVACGRLDAASRGLVLLTNDGQLCYEITHPKYEHEKEYIVTATINSGPPLAERLETLGTGLDRGEEKYGPAKISAVKRQDKKIVFHIVLKEGKNRQVRRMCSAVGLDVVDLFRVRVGRVDLDGLPEGRWRTVRRDELISSLSSVNE